MMRYWESWESQGENTSLCINEFNIIIVLFPFLVCCPGRFLVKNTSKLKDVIFHLFSLVESFLSASYAFTELQYDKYFSCHTESYQSCGSLPNSWDKTFFLFRQQWLDGESCMFQKYKGTENYGSSTGHKVAITQMRSFMVSQPFYCWPTLYQQ